MFEKIIREYWIDVCNFTLNLMQLITRAIKNELSMFCDACHSSAT
jgi:hypothetical protein